MALAVLPLAALLAWGRSEPPRRPGLEEDILRLTRETQALRGAVAEARAGTFIDHDDVIVGLHQDVADALLDAALPIQVEIPGVMAERVTARIDHATVLFSGGYGTVALDGRAWLSSFPSVAADVHLSGGISEVSIDPGTRALTATIGLDTLDARPLRGGVAALVLRGRLLHILNARARESISNALPPLVVPMRVSDDVHLADVTEGPLRVSGGELEVSASLRHVFASGGRLWVAVTPRLGAFHRSPGKP
ncbi:MAG: hypothetical protein JST54_27760 [Deltaproteobacteria bacterium]|nr:hypothetical protein [Deltaproteobacteria bacterium]